MRSKCGSCPFEFCSFKVVWQDQPPQEHILGIAKQPYNCSNLTRTNVLLCAISPPEQTGVCCIQGRRYEGLWGAGPSLGILGPVHRICYGAPSKSRLFVFWGGGGGGAVIKMLNSNFHFRVNLTLRTLLFVNNNYLYLSLIGP